MCKWKTDEKEGVWRKVGEQKWEKGRGRNGGERKEKPETKIEMNKWPSGEKSETKTKTDENKVAVRRKGAKRKRREMRNKIVWRGRDKMRNKIVWRGRDKKEEKRR